MMEAAALVHHTRSGSGSPNSNVVVYKQGGVFIHLCVPELNDDDKMLGGTLSILDEGKRQVLLWKALETITSMQVAEGETQVLSDSSSAVVGSNQEQQQPQTFTPPKAKEPIEPDWTLVADSSKNMQVQKDPLDQSVSGSEQSFYEFTMPLEEISVIKKSKKNVGWKYLVLELTDGASLPPLHFHQGGCKAFLKALDIYLLMTHSPKNSRVINVSVHDENALTRSFDELHMFGASSRKNFPSKALQHPVATAFSGFSKVTNFIQDMINPQESQGTRPARERANVIDDDATEAVGSSRIRIKPEGPGGFEVITCANLGPRSDPPRGRPLSVEVWNNHKDKEGRITNAAEVKSIIFKGGVVPELRKEVWKYLLNYYHWDMTRNDIKEHKKKKEEDYFRMKLQWKSISKDQEDRFSILKMHKSLIDKDVNRTDRTRLFYEGKDNCSLQLLNDVLMTYVMYNFDLGYVQGMNDLLSPLLELMTSEVDSFWCFVGFMNMVHLNFEKSQNGMKRQLRHLRTLIQFLDPQLFDNLTEKESNNLYFCFRWLLLCFKREFTYEEIQTLWEVLWTDLPCPHYHLLICVALLDTEKQTLMHPECGFTEILKHINEMSEKIDVVSTLRKAHGIYNQLAACNKRDIPDPVCEVLAL